VSRVEGRGKGSGDGLLLVALLVAGVLLGRLQTTAAKAGGLDPFGLVVRDAVALLGNPLNALFDGTGDFSRRLREGDRLARENDALKARLNAMALYEEQLALKDEQIANLRGLAGLKPLPGRERVSADVVDFVPYEGRITLNVGSERGVAPNMPAVWSRSSRRCGEGGAKRRSSPTRASRWVRWIFRASHRAAGSSKAAILRRWS
jgi:cell shape-determining protein MreC